METETDKKLDAEIGELVASVPRGMKKPVIFIGLDSRAAGREFSVSPVLDRAYESAGILSFPRPEEAVRAMYTLVEYGRIKRRFARGQTALD